MNLREMILPKKIITTHSFIASEQNFVTERQFFAYEAELIENIAKLEASALKVYGKVTPTLTHDFSECAHELDTHTALLICIEPIEKKVKKRDIINSVNSLFVTDREKMIHYEEMLLRIEKFGVE